MQAAFAIADPCGLRPYRRHASAVRRWRLRRSLRCGLQRLRGSSRGHIVFPLSARDRMFLAQARGAVNDLAPL